MKKVFLVFMLVCIGLLQAAAQSFTYTDDSGVAWGCYVTSSEDKTVQITSVSNVGSEVIIPEKVSDGTEEYTVTDLNFSFPGNKTIERVKWASTVTTISRSNMFSNCSNLKSIENTDKVTRIEGSYSYGAFSGCSNLENINLTNCNFLGYNAFSGCSKLASVIGLGNVETISGNAFCNCSSLESVDLTNCKSLGSSAFSGCSKLASVIGMGNIETISDDAFINCKELQSVELLKIKTLGDNVFWGTGIIKVTLPETLTRMGSNCFDALEYTFNGTVPPVLSDNSFGKNFTIQVPEGALNAYRTADVWSKYADKILSLGEKHEYDVTTTALDNKSGLEQAIGATNMKKVISLKVTGSINGYDIFMIRTKMTNLHYLDLSDANIVANGFAYYDSYSTKDNEVGEYMFFNLKNLVSLKLPKNSTSIKSDACRNCENLTEIVIPDGVTSIGYNAFHSCSSLTSIDIPSNVKFIGNHAFYGCSKLPTLVLPSSINHIGSNTFYDCENLTSVYANSKTPSEIYEPNRQERYDNCNLAERCTLYVPKGSVEAYSSSNWHLYFNDIKEFDVETGVQTIVSSPQSTEISRYDINGCKIAKPTKGINIIKYSDGSIRKEFVK